MENIIASSGNIFEDLGLSQPEERLAKADVAIRIEEIIQHRGLTQAQAARRMRVTQPEVSNIVRGRLKGFTLDRLFQCLNALDQDVEIVIRSKHGLAANTFVRVPSHVSVSTAETRSRRPLVRLLQKPFREKTDLPLTVANRSFATTQRDFVRLAA